MGILKNIWDFVSSGSGKTYANLAKTGVAALSTYASWKDQQKKNEMQQAAYDDWMAQAADAGHEAQAAVDINLTPMTVSGTPTTKADVTDFTAVAARGGLMSVPNRQRKRYAYGPGITDVMETEEESITPFDLQQETGIDLTGEQVKYDTGNSREGAWSVWNSGGIDQEIYEFDFEIFFDSGDWMDHLRGEVPMQGLQGNTMMASADPMLQDEYDKYVFDIQEQGGTPMSIEDFKAQAVAGQANGGIIGLRKGYDIGDIVTADTEAVVSEVPPERKNQIEGNQMAENAINEIILEFYRKFPEASEEDIQQMVRNFIAEEQFEGVLGNKDLGILGLDKAARMITPESVTKDEQRIARGDTQWGDIPYAKGGRIGYRLGDEVVEDRETMAESITLPDGGEEVVTDSMTETAGGGARGWKAQMLAEDLAQEQYGKEFYDLSHDKQMEIYTIALDMIDSGGMAQGGRIKKDNGGIMNLGGMEKDYRTTGGFVPIGGREKADDVPARLSKNEFVMTADAVRAAGGGSINKGAQRMYDTMKHLEASPQSKRMTA